MALCFVQALSVNFIFSFMVSFLPLKHLLIFTPKKASFFFLNSYASWWVWQNFLLNYKSDAICFVWVFRFRSPAWNAVKLAGVQRGRTVLKVIRAESPAKHLLWLMLGVLPFIFCRSNCSSIKLIQLFPSVSPAGSEIFVHQSKHRDWEKGPVAHCRGPGSLFVCTLTTRSSNRSPQLLQECLQVGD